MPSAQSARRPRWSLIVAAFAWVVVMFLALPALSAPRHGPVRQPIEFQVVTTIATVAALVSLTFSVSGWQHLLVAPLWIILLFLEYLAWIWPNRPNVLAGWAALVDLLVMVMIAGVVLIRRYGKLPTQNERQSRAKPHQPGG